MGSEKRDKILNISRIILIVFIAVIVIFASIKVFQIVNKLSVDEAYKINFEQSVRDKGVFGILLVIALQIAQIFIALIPGQPVEIIIGMLYGTNVGVLICIVGILLGTVIVYYTVKKIGKNIMKLFFNKGDIAEGESNIRGIKDDKTMLIFLTIIFLIPAIPKDIFIYFGPFINIKPWKFFLITTLCRIPGLYLTVYAGRRLTEGSYGMIGIVLGILALMAIVLYFVKSKKKKIQISE